PGRPRDRAGHHRCLGRAPDPHSGFDDDRVRVDRVRSAWMAGLLDRYPCVHAGGGQPRDRRCALLQEDPRDAAVEGDLRQDQGRTASRTYRATVIHRISNVPDESAVLIEGPWTHRLVSAGGIRFHVVEAGTGPLVVLLHGFPQFWWAWEQQIT